MSRKGSFSPGEFYHVYNRGVEKRVVFLSDLDHDRFRALLYLCNSTEPLRLDNLAKYQRGEALLSSALSIARKETLVAIGAYCLMPNHFHLLIQEKSDNGISRFIHKVSTAYTMYFNKRYARTGALFQGVFKSTHADDDRYLKYLISYIHLNPLKLIEPHWKDIGITDMAHAMKWLDDYPYSSYLDFKSNDRIVHKILDRDSLPDYFHGSADFDSHLTDWLEYSQESAG